MRRVCWVWVVASLLPFSEALPGWFEETRAFYTPTTCSGAGSNLMRYEDRCPGKLADVISSFSDLPMLLADSRQLGADLLYLVGWWEGGYSNKGAYVVASLSHHHIHIPCLCPSSSLQPDPKLGGLAALTQGIKSVRGEGGRVILYFEPFIVRRGTPFADAHKDWAMEDQSGNPYDYPGTVNEYYLMQPASGWGEYLGGLARELVKETGASGAYLDSYGCQAGWKDYNPKSPHGAAEPGFFEAAAANLTAKVLAAVEASAGSDGGVVLTECDALQGINNASSGAMDECITCYDKLPWVHKGSPPPYHVFSSEFSLGQLAVVVQQLGLGLSLNPWWGTVPWPKESDFTKWAAANMSLDHHDAGDTQRLMRDFSGAFAILMANGIDIRKNVDVDELIRQTIPCSCEALTWSTQQRTDTFHKAVSLAQSAFTHLNESTALNVTDAVRSLVKNGAW